MSRILITGGSGMLGSALTLALHQTHDLVSYDLKIPSEPTEGVTYVKGDVRDRETVASCVRNIDCIVHVAGFHWPQLAVAGTDEFYDVNVTGTFNVINAALKCGVPKVVFVSTIAVYGKLESRTRATFVDEETKVKPADTYEVTKSIAEDVCLRFCKGSPTSAIVLRMGRFNNRNPDYNVRKLLGGLDIRDAVRAIIVSIDASDIGTDIFCIASRVPFVPADAPELVTNPSKVVERYYPGCSQILEGLGLKLPDRIHKVILTEKAKQLLGFSPRFSFDAFLAELNSESRMRRDAPH
jgi:UDP-glucose 4-epimerase